MRRILCLTIAAVLVSSIGHAAVFRPITTLSAPVVRLSDLFDGLESDGDVVLGPGPAPGGRIVVEAAQLAAIARQFGVDWRPRGNERRDVCQLLLLAKLGGEHEVELGAAEGQQLVSQRI